MPWIWIWIPLILKTVAISLPQLPNERLQRKQAVSSSAATSCRASDGPNCEWSSSRYLATYDNLKSCSLSRIDSELAESFRFSALIRNSDVVAWYRKLFLFSRSHEVWVQKLSCFSRPYTTGFPKLFFIPAPSGCGCRNPLLFMPILNWSL